MAQVLDLALDFPLLVSPPWRTRPWCEVIVAGELEQPRMKPNGTALAFEHGTAKVVVVMCPPVRCGGSPFGSEYLEEIRTRAAT
jgi:hypothetical protein